jgi:RNA polymerase sigma-70 factor (ECF subfamily)
MKDRQNIRECIEKARKGDREAFRLLIAECREALVTSVRRRIGAHLRSEVEVEDVIQETYAQALTSIERFQWGGEGSFLRWLRGIAEHVILNLARRQRNDPILFVEHDQPHGGPSPSKSLRRDERLDRFQEALDSLPSDYREALILVRIEGQQIKEAARRMNRSPKAVKHLLARALGKLKDAFGDTESLSLPPGQLAARENPTDT